MRGIILTITVFLLAAGTCWAAVPTATISVPAAGEHFYWFSYTDIKGNPAVTTPKLFKDKKVTADVPLVKDAVPKGTLLYVLDAKTGNEAIKPLEGKGSLAVDLKKSDFDKVRKVVVWVIGTVTDRPIAAAIIKLVDADKKAQQRMLDPSSVGSAEFNNVAEGTASVTVLYGHNKKSIQDVDITLERESPVLKIDIPIAGEIEFVGVSPYGPSDFDKSEQSDKEGPQAKGVDYITGLIGAILLIIVVYFAVRMMRDKGAGAKSILKKLGVHVEEDQPLIEPAKPAPPVDPTICPFCGQKKDASGACSCSVIGAAASAVSAASGPRLVAIQGPRMGEVYDLQAGTLTIGREESNTVAFPGDSTVSRRHARIASDAGVFTVYDEGSSNGTFVNGVKVTEQVLHSGDEIQIGTTRLRFEA